MACFLCSLWGSRSWILSLIPIFAVFASFSSGNDVFSISIMISSLLLILLSTFVFVTFSKKNPIKVDNSIPTAYIQFLRKSHDEIGEIEEKKVGENEFLIQSQDLYSESESLDQFSTTSSEEDHSSDAEQRLDCSDDSISDEESLIEIEIPSGEFLSPKRDSKFNLKCCKLSADFTVQKQFGGLDFLTEMNEEDNLIEIDIYMGSIKYSSYGI